MDLTPFYSCEGFIEDFQCLNGHWLWKFTHVIDDNNSTIASSSKQLEFIDCYGKAEKTIFIIDKPADAEDIDALVPITEQYFLMKCYYIIDDTAEIAQWSILELDWFNKTSKIGDKKFECNLLDDITDHDLYKPLLDKTLSNGNDLFFLIYHKENAEQQQWNCCHYKLNKKQLNCQQLGSTFVLPINLFNCISLNDNFIRGLSSSLTEISTFNLNTKNLVSPAQKVFDIPSSICLDVVNKAGFYYLPAVGAWTSTKFYIWSEKILENEPCNSIIEIGGPNIARCCKCNIFVIDLITGHTTQLPQTFYGQIRELYIDAGDENLIVRNEQYLRQEKYNHGMAAPYMRSFFKFQLFKLPI